MLQPKQFAASAAARDADLDDGPTEIGYGGARGGGKSHWLLAQMGADDCQRYPGLKCLLLRKVGSAIREALQDLRQKTLRNVPHRFIESKGILLFPNGSQIILGHFKDEKDVDKYLGLEYDVIGVEEATTLSESKYEMIRTCCRTSKPGWRPRIYLTTNPGGLGHAWFKRVIVEPFRKGIQQWTRFIPATVRDNAFVNKEYRRTLEALTGWKRRAWLDGDFDIAAGQFFTTFRRDVHVVGEESSTRSVPDALPLHWRVWLALDYGFTHYTVCYLLAEDGDGNVYIWDEHAERRWLIPRHADAIKAMLARHNVRIERLSTFVAGHDVFSMRDEGETIADKYAKEGLPLLPAVIDRINGAAEILDRFGDVEATNAQGEAAPMPPSLFIHERCVRLIECIPTLQHNPTRPEDVLKIDCDEEGKGGDDAYDGGRYGIMEARRQPPQLDHYEPLSEPMRISAY